MKILFISLLLIPSIISQVFYSPNNDLNMNILFNSDGYIAYNLFYKEKEIISTSLLGLKFKNYDFFNNFELRNTEISFKSNKWYPILGEYKEIKDEYNQIITTLLHKSSNKEMILNIRLYNDGVAFRYEISSQSDLNNLELEDELTEFKLTGNHKVFWIPSDFDSQEHIYQETFISDIKIDSINLNNGVLLQSISGNQNVQTPLMMKTEDNLYINIFEAAVKNYPVMHLAFDNLHAKCLLANNSIGKKAHIHTPFKSPWRTIFVSYDPKKIIEEGTKITLNLNDPSDIKDDSWIKPIKYIGIWWEMHVSKSTWNYYIFQNQEKVPHEKHGATTENAKRYIDFAKEHGFDAVLIEGWNNGWEDIFFLQKEDSFDFISPYPDFNIEEVSKYAKQKEIKLIMHHETSGSIINYERWLDRAINLMEKYEYLYVKTGYVGKLIPRGEYHDGQFFVNHIYYTISRFAEKKILVNTHESTRPTGMHRTYPNYISAEAARGNEFNAWSNGNPPMHETILPFTRLLGGPFDYTPGIFEMNMSIYTNRKDSKIKTTLVKQLALYVIIYSPMQMAADIPENYLKYEDAFQFIKDVPVDWDDTIILEAEPGDYITTVRKEKGRENWYLGSISDENERTTTISLDFLRRDRKYIATLYEDGEDANWENNQISYKITKEEVDFNTILILKLKNSGGAAISIKEELEYYSFIEWKKLELMWLTCYS